MPNGQKSTRLSAKVATTICMRIAHFVTVMWTLAHKERRPLKGMLARRNINATDGLQAPPPSGCFFGKQRHRLKMTRYPLQNFVKFIMQFIIIREIFSDSSTAKGMTCGKTKAKALCQNVLAPYSVQTHTDYKKTICIFLWQPTHQTKVQPSVFQLY